MGSHTAHRASPRHMLVSSTAAGLGHGILSLTFLLAAKECDIAGVCDKAVFILERTQLSCSIPARW